MKVELNKKVFIGGIVTIILLLCGMIIFGVCYSNTVDKYRMEIDELSKEKSKLIEENDELMGTNSKLSKKNNDLTEEIDSLHDNIYNLFKKQPYELIIRHDGKYVIYQQDSFGLFDSHIESVLQ